MAKRKYKKPELEDYEKLLGLTTADKRRWSKEPKDETAEEFYDRVVASPAKASPKPKKKRKGKKKAGQKYVWYW